VQGEDGEICPSVSGILMASEQSQEFIAMPSFRPLPIGAPSGM